MVTGGLRGEHRLAAVDDLLGPHREPRTDWPQDDETSASLGFRFHDAPPDVVQRVLVLIDPFFTTSRPNEQPPADWLLALARDLDGLFGGHAAAGRPSVRVDAIQVRPAAAAAMVTAVRDAFPARGEWSSAVDLAVGQVWPDRSSVEATWEGRALDLLTALPPGDVVGLWWD